MGNNILYAVMEGNMKKIVVITVMVFALLGFALFFTQCMSGTAQETDIIQDDINAIEPIVITNTLNVKVVEIGKWDMDFYATIGIEHGVDFKKIRSVDAIVINDNETLTKEINSGPSSGYVSYIGDRYVRLARISGGVYDNTNWDDYQYNRGWVTIWYEE